MMRRRGTILVVLSLVLAAFAAWAANAWVTQRLNTSPDEAGDVAVVAALEIPYGTKIEGRHLKTITMPLGSRPDNAFAETAAVEGKVSTALIARNELIVASRLAEHESGSTLAALVQSNMRAITVRVDDVVGVAGFLLPGNRVDVLATRMDRSSRRATSETILRNIKVLAVDQTAATDQNEPVIVRAVTLEMLPPQAETLVKAREEGSIQLALRNPFETEVVAEKPKVEKVAKPKVVVAAKPRWVPSKVTVIRGTNVDNVKPKI